MEPLNQLPLTQIILEGLNTRKNKKQTEIVVGHVIERRG